MKSAADALLASLNHRGTLDFDYMKDIYPHTKEEMVAELGERLFYLEQRSTKYEKNTFLAM